MKNSSTYLLFLFLFAFCGSPSTKDSPSNVSENVTWVEGDDSIMNAAIFKARETFRIFDTAFKNGHFDTSQFSIKVKFPTNEGGEHIWANSLTFDNGNYYGTVDEDAVSTAKVKAGDRVKITMDNLSDWLYNDNGVLRGGYTIKALRYKMTVQERAAFDSSFFLKIVD